MDLTTVPSPTARSWVIYGKLGPAVGGPGLFRGRIPALPAKPFARAPGVGHPRCNPLPDQLPLELGYRGEDVEHQPRGGVVVVCVNVLPDSESGMIPNGVPG